MYYIVMRSNYRDIPTSEEFQNLESQKELSRVFTAAVACNVWREKLVNFLCNERVSEGLVDGQPLGWIQYQALLQKIFELVDLSHVCIIQGLFSYKCSKEVKCDRY